MSSGTPCLLEAVKSVSTFALWDLLEEPSFISPSLSPGCLESPPVTASFGDSPPLEPPLPSLQGPWEMPESTNAFIPIQVAGIQYRIYTALTLSRQEGTARLMGWAGWGNNRLFDVTSLIGVDLLTD